MFLGTNPPAYLYIFRYILYLPSYFSELASPLIYEIKQSVCLQIYFLLLFGETPQYFLYHPYIISIFPFYCIIISSIRAYIIYFISNLKNIYTFLNPTSAISILLILFRCIRGKCYQKH